MSLQSKTLLLSEVLFYGYFLLFDHLVYLQDLNGIVPVASLTLQREEEDIRGDTKKSQDSTETMFSRL